MTDLLVWFALLEVMALTVLPLFARLLPWSGDAGWGLARVGGLVIPGFLLWFAGMLGVMPSTAGSGALILLLLAVVNWGWAVRRAGGFTNAVRGRRVECLTSAAVFYGVTGLFLIIRAYNPEIHWGEKPMDFSFLNFFTRLESLPPQDPWAAGRLMHYYYLGFYLVALVLKLGTIPPGVGYTLAVATFPGLLAAACYSTVRQLLPRRRIAALIAPALLLFGNVEVLRLAFIERMPLDSHLFWASTRIYTSPSFSEYPLWTYLFADLHPHMMALPVTMLLAGLGVPLLISPSRSRGLLVLHRTVYALIWGSLVVLNAWDFLGWGLVTGLLLLARPWHMTHGQGAHVIAGYLGELVRRGIELAAMGALALLFVMPFFGSRPPSGAPLPFLTTPGEFNTTTSIMLMHGLWIVPLVGVIFFVRGRSYFGVFLRALAAAVFPLALGLFSHLAGTYDIPWATLALTGLLLCAAFTVGAGSGPDRARRATAVWIAAGALLIGGSEMIVLIDRMNTIFKFHTAAFVLLALGSLAAAALLCADPVRSFTRKALCGLWVSTWVLGVVAGGVILYIVLGSNLHWSIRGPRPTLDGTRYLHVAYPDEAVIIDWVAEHVEGIPVILEAHGPAYQRYTRITNNTGLRTVLGWEHHAKQRGLPEEEARRRERDIQQMYLTVDRNYLQKLLRKYDVSLIVVGDLERERYPGPGLDKFAANPELFPLLSRSGSTSLYGTPLWLERQQGGEDEDKDMVR